MKNQLFTERRGCEIPSFDLEGGGQSVLFALRTMEEIFDENGPGPDYPHRHNFYTIIFIIGGTGTHVIDFKEHSIKPSRAFFLSPGQVHQVYTPLRPEGLVIMFTKDFLCKYHINEELLTNPGLFSCTPDSPPIDLPEKAAARLAFLGKEIGLAFTRKERYVYDEVASWLKLFLIECNIQCEAGYNDNTQLLETGRSVIGGFHRFLDQKYKEWHQVSDYARELDITSDYLNSVMKSATGTSAKDFIQKKIVIEAKRLGVYTEMNSKEIAYELGFQDPSHFSTFFKNVDGRTFSQFKAEEISTRKT